MKNEEWKADYDPVSSFKSNSTKWRILSGKTLIAHNLHPDDAKFIIATKNKISTMAEQIESLQKQLDTIAWYYWCTGMNQFEGDDDDGFIVKLHNAIEKTVGTLRDNPKCPNCSRHMRRCDDLCLYCQGSE